MKRGSGHGWPIAVVVTLALVVGLNVLVLFAANDRDAAVVEPDYYRRAVAWDSTLAASAREQRLGWSLDLEVGSLEPGGVPVRARLLDRDGRPLGDARIEVVAIHNRYAAHEVHGALAPDDDGGYRGTLALPRAGLWELRFAVRHGNVQWHESVRRDVATAATKGRP